MDSAAFFIYTIATLLRYPGLSYMCKKCSFTVPGGERDVRAQLLLIPMTVGY
jgi:hypothetical protein